MKDDVMKDDVKKIPFVSDRKTVKNTAVYHEENMVTDVVLTTEWKGQHVLCKWKLDFSKCTPSEMMELGKRSAVILNQSRFRRAERGELIQLAERTIDVHESMAAKRREATPATPDSVVATATAMSIEEQRKIIENLQKQIDEATNEQIDEATNG